jgi:EVE domain
MSKNWVAVASAEHVRIGRSKGFMQVCHGKAAPLRRVHPGDGVVYYSPTSAFQGKDKLQSFTAIGVVKDGSPYQETMGGFYPFRRDVSWRTAEETPIKPLIERLQFTTEEQLGVSAALRTVRNFRTRHGNDCGSDGRIAVTGVTASAPRAG